MESLNKLLLNAKIASKEIVKLSNKEVNEIIYKISDNLINNLEYIISENKKDLENGVKSGLSNAMIDRLMIDEKRLTAIANDMKKVADLPDVIDDIIEEDNKDEEILTYDVQKKLFALAQNNKAGAATSIASRELAKYRQFILTHVGANYIQQVPYQDKILRWDTKTFPLKVFIEDTAGLPDYYLPNVRLAFASWYESTGGLVSFEFVDNAESFSICVMPEKYRKELNYCGTISGRDENKIEKCGFTVEKENDVPYFAEARLTLICKKLYAKELSEDGFIEKKYADTFYSDKDWHVMYIAEIEKVLVE
mgnify:CR=1 FL=1